MLQENGLCILPDGRIARILSIRYCDILKRMRASMIVEGRYEVYHLSELQAVGSRDMWQLSVNNIR